MEQEGPVVARPLELSLEKFSGLRRDLRDVGHFTIGRQRIMAPYGKVIGWLVLHEGSEDVSGLLVRTKGSIARDRRGSACIQLIRPYLAPWFLVRTKRDLDLKCNNGFFHS